MGVGEVRRRALLLAATMAVTFIGVRAYLHTSPDADFNLGAYNVHHLFTGLILIAVFGPIAVLRGSGGRVSNASLVGFGVGLSLALDEWVYLIVTDGSNASYLLPVSFWGGLTVVGLACVYVVAVSLRAGR